MTTERLLLAREVIRVVMATAAESDKIRAGKSAWRAFTIETNRLEMIEEAEKRGESFVEAGAARADDPMRRLRQHRNGTWQMRITITRIQREVGKQIIMNLETSDLEEAQKRRDLFERTFVSIGLLSSRATAGIE
tara:strand:- start:168 stop:572 length:405 start_codon:yes stop_codon:yes gene_type:complete